MEELTKLQELVAAGKCQTCTDHDEECDDMPDKVSCWLYAPEKGMCPYLRPPSPRSPHE